MAKIVCAISGLEIKVDHFPIYLDSRECMHPVFAMHPKKLPLYYHKWVNNELTPTDSYLLFLALLNSTELIDWRVSVRRTENTGSLVANYMTPLFSIIQKIQGIKHPSFAVPSIAITQETNTLDNVKYWIQSWNEAYTDFLSGLARSELRSKLARREQGLEKLIKSPQIKPEKYAGILASWAAEAGNFPTFYIANPLAEGETTSISEYWQDIIIRCYKTENILAIPPKDLQELTEHCEDNLDTGTIFSHHLFAALEEGKSRQTNFYGLGDFISLSSENPGFRILDAKTNVEDANISVMIDSAPSTKPDRKDYPSDFKYLQAKAKWEAAQKFSVGLSIGTTNLLNPKTEGDK